jgi:hypothetical protein
MANKKSKRITKRPSKGQRTYTRRLKQAARKEAGVTSPQSGPTQPVRTQKKQDQAD